MAEPEGGEGAADDEDQNVMSIKQEADAEDREGSRDKPGQAPPADAGDQQGQRRQVKQDEREQRAGRQ
jgi:hypothetical protein